MLFLVAGFFSCFGVCHNNNPFFFCSLLLLHIHFPANFEFSIAFQRHLKNKYSFMPIVLNKYQSLQKTSYQLLSYSSLVSRNFHRNLTACEWRQVISFESLFSFFFLWDIIPLPGTYLFICLHYHLSLFDSLTNYYIESVQFYYQCIKEKSGEREREKVIGRSF